MLVSVIIPCYNDAIYLPYAIKSVREQSFNPALIEVIVVDDGSTDDTSLIAGELGVTVIQQENKGLSAARNTGIRECSGAYILPLDADDRIHSTYIEHAVAVLSMNKHIGVVHTHRQHFGELDTIKLGEQFSIELLKEKCIINYCSMFRKQVWVDCGGYDESMRLGFEDWNFWFSVYETGWSFYLLDQVLFFYRKHQNRLSHIAQRNLIQLQNVLKEKHPTIFT